LIQGPLIQGLTYMKDNMQKYLIPKEGLIVRDPKSFTPLPEDGLLVDWNGNAGRYWRKRVKQGDCIELKEKEIKLPETISFKRKKKGDN